MADTVATIIADCVSAALGLPRDPIQTELRDIALAEYNDRAELIYQSWPWENERMDNFDVTPGADGIVTFNTAVERIIAINGITNDLATTRIYNEDPAVAAEFGLDVSQDRFQHLADTALGAKRIRFNTDNAFSTYRVRALQKYVKAIVDPAYDSTDPDATPTDYRVQVFAIRHAQPALRAFIKDALRTFQLIQPTNEGRSLLDVALKRERIDDEQSPRIFPRYPQFGDVGAWQ